MAPAKSGQVEVTTKAEHIRGMFARIAHRYDLVNTLMSFGQDNAWRQMAVDLAKPGRHSLAIDVATGTAELATKLAYSVRSVVAVDFCWEMMKRGREKVRKRGAQSKIQFVLADALMLPFKDSSFDCALVGFAMRNVASIPGSIAELRRIIKPGGYVVCLELTRPTLTVVAALHRIYLHRLIPILGHWLSGDNRAYTYLPDSIARFPTADELKSIMKEVGLRQVRYKLLNLGTVALHIGLK